MLRNKVIKLVALSIIVITLSISIVIAINRQKNVVSPTITNEFNINSKEPKIAVLRNVGIDKNDLWIMNSDGSKEKQITTAGMIDKLFGWSPDNKYVAVSIREDDKSRPQHFFLFLAAVDVDTGKLYKIYEKENGMFNVKWISNNQIVDLEDYKNLIRTVATEETINISDALKKYKSEGYSSLSPDNKWLVYEKTEMQINNSVFNTVNLDTGNKYTIVPADAKHEYFDWNIGFSGTKLLYSTSKKGLAEIWQSDMDGKNKVKLLDIPLSKTDINDDASAVYLSKYNPDSFFLFTIMSHSREKSSRLMKYDFETKQLTEVDLSEIIKDVGILNNFYSGSAYNVTSFSPDQRYITVKASDYRGEENKFYVYRLDLTNNEVVKLCNNSCNSPIWSN